MKDRFREFFDSEYSDDIRALADSFPEERSLRIDFEILREYDPSLAEEFRTNPQETRETAIEVLEALEPRLTTHDALDPAVRVHNLPADHEYRVGKYRQQHLGQLLAVRGTVVGTDPVTPFADVAAWRCSHDDCGAITRTEQSYGAMVPPNACKECERKGGDSEFDFSHSHSDLVDHQEIVVMPVDTTSDDPPMIPVHLKDDLCDIVDKGHEILIVGVFETFPGQNDTVLNTYIEAIDFEVEDYAEVDTEQATDLEDRIIAEVTEYQDAGNWGQAVSAVVSAVADDKTPETAVRERIDELADDRHSNVEKEGDDQLVVID